MTRQEELAFLDLEKSAAVAKESPSSQLPEPGMALKVLGPSQLTPEDQFTGPNRIQVLEHLE